MERRVLIVLLSLLCSCSGQRSVSQDESNADKAMPLSYFKSSGLYNSMNNSARFVNLFFENKAIGGTADEDFGMSKDDKRLTPLGSTSVDDLERSELATKLNHAGCDPYDQVVPIPNDRSNVLYYPSCVLIKQCGGCCGHPSLACKPTATKNKIIQVMKYVYDGLQAHPVENVDIAKVEEHTSCECQCKLTEADCNAQLQDFDDWDCKCMCKKSKENCGHSKRWDESLCACRCASVQNCGTGFRYNMVTCSCEEDSERSEGPVASNDVDSQPDNVVEEVVTVDPCGHLDCPKFYNPVPKSGGLCRCLFDGDAYRKSLNS